MDGKGILIIIVSLLNVGFCLQNGWYGGAMGWGVATMLYLYYRTLIKDTI